MQKVKSNLMFDYSEGFGENRGFGVSGKSLDFFCFFLFLPVSISICLVYFRQNIFNVLSHFFLRCCN